MKLKRSEAKSKRYPSDVTRTQWKRLKPLLPEARPGGRPRSVDLREIVNGIRPVSEAGPSSGPVVFTTSSRPSGPVGSSVRRAADPDMAMSLFLYAQRCRATL